MRKIEKKVHSIKCSKVTSLVVARSHFKLVAEKNIQSKADTVKKLKVAKRVLLEIEKNRKIWLEI